MKFTLLDTPYHLSLLAKLGEPTTGQPDISQLIKSLYESLFSMVTDGELETEKVEIKTRIYSSDKRGVYKGLIFKKNQNIVVIDVIRAGIEPSSLFYGNLTKILNPERIHQDHIMSERIEGETGVTGANLMGSKIGGSVRNKLVFIPDPMGATGNSMKEIIEFYERNYGPAKCYIPVHLVVTDRYLKTLEKIKAPIHVYAARKDKGLTKNDFIYPGLGGVGEMINNTKK